MSNPGVEAYWNTSSNLSYNFDDEDEPEDPNNTDDVLDCANTDLIFGADTNDNSYVSLPVHSIISKKNFNSVLDDVSLHSVTSIPLIQETILKMFLGMPHNLHVYRSINLKLELLDEAVGTQDGNVILSVLLHLEKTLKSTILFHHLAKRKIALQHYSNYLLKQLNLDELANLYMATGNVNDIGLLFYAGYKHMANKEYNLTKLNRFLMEHESKLNHNQRNMFLDYKKFLNWQMEKKMKLDSVMEQLTVLCKNECENISSNNKSSQELKDLFKINNFQYEWIMLNTVCALKMWKKLTNIFIKPNWLSKKNSLKTCIDSELFMSTLCNHEAPKQILEQFLTHVDNFDLALSFALKMSCHKFIIDSYLVQKNRSALWNYKQDTKLEQDDLNYVETAIRSLDKK